MRSTQEIADFRPETFEPVLFSFGVGAGQDDEIYKKRFLPRIKRIAKNNKLPVRTMTVSHSWMDADATFDVHAQRRAEAEDYFRRDGERLVRVAWSREGNVAERFTDNVDHIIHVASAFSSETIGRPIYPLDKDMPPLKTDLYMQALIDHQKDSTIPEGFTKFDPELAGEVFYNLCSPADRAWAVERMRGKRQRRMAEPALENWRKDMRRDYLVCTADNAIPPEWQVYVAVNWLELRPFYIEADHTPMLSRAERFAYMLLRIVNPE